jgi:hypothetical protein
MALPRRVSDPLSLDYYSSDYEEKKGRDLDNKPGAMDVAGESMVQKHRDEGYVGMKDIHEAS